MVCVLQYLEYYPPLNKCHLSTLDPSNRLTQTNINDRFLPSISNQSLQNTSRHTLTS